MLFMAKKKEEVKEEVKDTTVKFADCPRCKRADCCFMKAQK